MGPETGRLSPQLALEADEPAQDGRQGEIEGRLPGTHQPPRRMSRARTESPNLRSARRNRHIARDRKPKVRDIR